MLLDGLALALLTAAGFYLVYQTLPEPVRTWMTKHLLFTRVGCAVLTYMLLGGTATALFAAAWFDLIVGTLMTLARNPTTAAMLDRMFKYLAHIRNTIITWANEAINQLPTPPEPQNTPETPVGCVAR